MKSTSRGWVFFFYKEGDEIHLPWLELLLCLLLVLVETENGGARSVPYLRVINRSPRASTAVTL
jgi:hypothetical protein